MKKRLTKSDTMEVVGRRLVELLDGRGEWFCTERGDGTRPTELRKGEWDVRASPGALLFSFWNGAGGLRVWRIVAWEWTGERLLLEASRRAGAERAMLELIPRARALTAKAALTAARRAAVEGLAALACAHLAGARVERVGLSAGRRRNEPGRYARILLRRGRERIAVTGAVADLGRYDLDTFLASTLVWFMRLVEKARDPLPLKLSIVVTRDLSEVIGERIALLREDLRGVTDLSEVDETERVLVPVRLPELSRLLESATRFHRPAETALSGRAARVVALAPDAIDAVNARHGQTLRFHGLPFARVRRIMDREQIWFGVAGAPKRQLLDDDDWPELLKLVRRLAEHRRAKAEDHRHALYAAAPEAWLESLLRRDVTRLDPGLRLSPLHAQFRTSRDARAGARPIDLLALRRDGQLVVIELKVSEDVAHPLQGADYWRRVETHRRSGRLTRARLFGDARIADAPPLVYLVAPMLRFHRAFQTLARAIRPEVETYRFDINEDWRAGVRVMRRTRVN